MSRHHLSCGHLSISAISQLLLARFGSNFKQRVLGTYTTVYNCHPDICPGNICPRDICSYQQYLSCYWTNLDQTLTTAFRSHLFQMPYVRVTFVQATFVLGTFVHTYNISSVSDQIFTKLFGPTFFGTRIFLPKFCFIQTCFWTSIFVVPPNLFGPNSFWTQNFCTQIFLVFFYLIEFKYKAKTTQFSNFNLNIRQKQHNFQGIDSIEINLDSYQS